MGRLLLSSALLLTCALAPAPPAAAGTLADVTLPDKVDAGGQALVLNGLGLRKKFFVKVYVGGLYLPAKEHAAAKVLAADAPRRMTLHFVYSVSAQQMCDAWKEGLADNTPSAGPQVQAGVPTPRTHTEDSPQGHAPVLA